MTKTLSSRERLSPREKQPVDLFSSQQQSDESSETTRKSVAQSPMQPPVGGLQVVHATAGRVRIRATDGSHNSILETISQKLRKKNGVKEASVNQETSSLVIHFDAKKLPLPQMLEQLQQFNIYQLQASPQAGSQKDPFAAWKSLDFWKEQGISFIPLFTGLAVTGGLGISGLASIPVYLITTNATRRVIDELQQPKSQTSAPRSSQPIKNEQKSSTKHNTTDQLSSSKVEHTSVAAAAQPAKITSKITYSVVHAIPGRIRLNVPRVAGDRAYARRLERLLKTESQVTNVRVNCDAASIAITYQSEVPVSHWVGLMQLADETIPQIKPIKTTTTEQSICEPVDQTNFTKTATTTEQPPSQPVHQLVKPVESTRQKEQPTTLETAGMWSDFKSPALGAALSFMANFPLNLVPY
ncbi:HMA2 domain-containing protein [Brasilonema sp. UFV-L1]|uniref:HMA2 domain-containing protein n=1 Tax=Brasilonema sp. UFV-L1 TaxID=2234130 RepID=UPI00145E4D95|nr:hypothetical protein [Brasilonema sp. UFV-L1]NMG07264.1 hypothetical protein [Brasilonema sp. UFV-L1]